MHYFQILAIVGYSIILASCNERVSGPEKMPDYTNCDSNCVTYPDTSYKSFVYSIEDTSRGSAGVANPWIMDIQQFIRTIHVESWAPVLRLSIRDSGKNVEYLNGMPRDTIEFDSTYIRIDTSFGNGQARLLFPYYKYLPDSSLQASVKNVEYRGEKLRFVDWQGGYTFRHFLQKYGLVYELRTSPILASRGHTILIEMNSKPFNRKEIIEANYLIGQIFRHP